MSSSIAIPKARQSGADQRTNSNITSSTPQSPDTRMSTSLSSSLATSSPAGSVEHWDSPVAKRSAEEKGKGKRISFSQAVESPPHPRRVSWLGNEISRSEHTVVDVGNIGGIPRLVSRLFGGIL